MLVCGCELTEVTLPIGESRIVVHAVLNRTAGRQFVVVERSITGEGRASGSDLIPPGGPARGIENALVVLEYAAGTACGPAADTLPQLPDAPGVYQAEGLCTPAPGDGVGLRVVTPEGTVVSGRTTVPGARRVAIERGGDTVSGVPAEFIVNRDHDTLNLSADPIAARALQVEIRTPEVESPMFGNTDDLVFYIVTDSLGFRLPGDLINPFESDEGETLFRGGVSYDLSIVLADTNYYDFVRSRSNPLTGRGFINRLQGGIGVFGSVETHIYRMGVVSDVDQPAEGLYLLRGTVGGRPADVTWELYRDALDERRFAAFMKGTWYGGVVDGSVEGYFLPFSQQPAEFYASFRSASDTSVIAWDFQGIRGGLGSSFTVNVQGFSSGSSFTGSLTATQLTGPVVMSRAPRDDGGRPRRP
jgi:hypothetical protein